MFHPAQAIVASNKFYSRCLSDSWVLKKEIFLLFGVQSEHMLFELLDVYRV